MRTLTLPLLAAPLVAAALFALDRRARALRTRRQVIDVLAALPELEGTVPVGHAERVAALAEDLGEGLDRRSRGRLAVALRLAHLDPTVADAAGVEPATVHLVRFVRGRPTRV